MSDVHTISRDVNLGYGTITGQNRNYDPFAHHCKLGLYTSSFDCSNSLRLCIVDPLESTAPDWSKLITIFLDESEHYFKRRSGWLNEVNKTPSPQVDLNKIKLLYEKLSFLQELATKNKKSELNEKYGREKQKYLHYLGHVSEQSLDQLFDSISEKIVQFPYKASAVEITPDKAIFFELRMSEFILHFKVILSDPTKPKAFFALYENSNCRDNGVGPIDDILNHLLDIKKNAIIPSSSITQESI